MVGASRRAIRPTAVSVESMSARTWATRCSAARTSAVARAAGIPARVVAGYQAEVEDTPGKAGFLYHESGRGWLVKKMAGRHLGHQIELLLGHEVPRFVLRFWVARPPLVAFLMGVVAHSVSDATWHSLGIDQGFIHQG